MQGRFKNQDLSLVQNADDRTPVKDPHKLNNGNKDDSLFHSNRKGPAAAEEAKEDTNLVAESDGEGDKLSEVKKKKKVMVPSKKKRLIMNVSSTKYSVVRYVAKSVYKMKLTCSDEEDWDIFWTDSAVQCDKLYRMKNYQRINHFPGMYNLARKNHLARNLQRMQRHFPEAYKFFPHTWLLPSEYSDFRSQFNV